MHVVCEIKYVFFPLYTDLQGKLIFMIWASTYTELSTTRGQTVIYRSCSIGLHIIFPPLRFQNSYHHCIVLILWMLVTLNSIKNLSLILNAYGHLKSEFFVCCSVRLSTQIYQCHDSIQPLGTLPSTPGKHQSKQRGIQW